MFVNCWILWNGNCELSDGNMLYLGEKYIHSVRFNCVTVGWKANARLQLVLWLHIKSMARKRQKKPFFLLFLPFWLCMSVCVYECLYMYLMYGDRNVSVESRMLLFRFYAQEKLDFFFTSCEYIMYYMDRYIELIYSWAIFIFINRVI